MASGRCVSIALPAFYEQTLCQPQGLIVGEFGYALPTSKNNMSIRHICQLEFICRPPIRIYMPLQVIVASQGQENDLA
jgi:hypothetical protein